MSDDDALLGEMRRFQHGLDADPLAPTADMTERLLSGRPSPDIPPAYATLAEVLAAAAAPASPEELTVAPSVLEAFRAERGPSRTGRAKARPKRASSRVLRTVVLAAAAVMLLAGTALATGNLLVPPQRPPGTTSGTGGQHPATTAAGADQRGERGSAVITPPSTGAAGLCRAYLVGAKDEKAKAAAFEALVTAAGGRERVGTFCGGPVPSPATTQDREDIAPSDQGSGPTPTHAGASSSRGAEHAPECARVAGGTTNCRNGQGIPRGGGLEPDPTSPGHQPGSGRK